VNVHAFADSERLARSVAKLARARFAPIAVHRFPDGGTNGIEIALLLAKALTGLA
jgi:hypothetical protein